MKTMKNIKILFLLLITGLLTWNTFAATIEKIEAIDNNSVQLTANSDIVFSAEKVEWEIKLLKDIIVSFSVKDTTNIKKVLLNLWTDLTVNSSYSLITILGADWNIDFKVNDSLVGEYVNANLVEWETWIEKVNIIDSKTVEVYFTDDLTESTFEFKLLSDIELSSISSIGDNKLNLEILKNIEKSTNYIVMILSLVDVNGNAITFDEDLYDFSTSADLIQAVVVEEAITTTSISEEIETATWVEEEEWNIIEVAKITSTTPATGTTTSILIMITILLSLGFFFRKSFVK